MNKERTFHYLFLTLFCVFFYKEMWRHLDKPMPESFYFPQQILNISAGNFLMLSYVIKYFLVLLVAFAFYKIDIFIKSKSLSLALAVCSLLLVVHRFNFYHYPSLEMYPILALFGFAIASNTDDKLFNSIALMSMVYFFSGLTKLRFSGLGWIDSDKIFEMMNYSLRNRESHVFVSDQFLIAVKPWLSVVGFFTYVFECFFPVILFFRALRKPIFIITFVFHFLIWLVFNIYSTGVLFPIVILYYFAYEDFNNFCTKMRHAFF